MTEQIAEQLLELLTLYPAHWWAPGTGVSNKMSAAEEAIERDRILREWDERRHPYRRKEATDA